jgi:hypothetical protein
MLEAKLKTPRFERNPAPSPMRLQKRDGEIFQAINTYDGVLARRQIKSMFWPESTVQAVERRLSLLYHNGFLNWPDINQRRTKPIPEPVVWLGWRGILHLAGEMEIDVPVPNNAGENQMRLLEKRLREGGIGWQREPRWSQLEHDIAVNDFRFAIERAVKKWPSVTLESWVPEGDFLREMDTIEFEYEDQVGRLRKRRKGVRPDGYFVLLDHLRQIDNSPARARFLLEFDNGNHPLTRFGRDKAAPGVAYVRSKSYKQRFGFNSGRWLIVSNGEKRMHNLKIQTEKAVGANASIFLFSSMDQIEADTVLNMPIWIRGGSNEMMSLVNTIEAR